MSQDPMKNPDDVALDWVLRMADPARADWDGSVVAKGPFRRAAADLAATVRERLS